MCPYINSKLIGEEEHANPSGVFNCGHLFFVLRNVPKVGQCCCRLGFSPSLQEWCIYFIFTLLIFQKLSSRVRIKPIALLKAKSSLSPKKGFLVFCVTQATQLLPNSLAHFILFQRDSFLKWTLYYYLGLNVTSPIKCLSLPDSNCILRAKWCRNTSSHILVVNSISLGFYSTYQNYIGVVDFMCWYIFYLHSYHLSSFLYNSPLYFMLKKQFYKERKFKFLRQKLHFILIQIKAGSVYLPE